MLKNIIISIEKKSLIFLDQFKTNKTLCTFNGDFSLYAKQTEPDLYGMLDSVFILYILNKLKDRTTIDSRKEWAEKIQSCQDSSGKFSLKNFRGHSIEHATAYAIAALILLQQEKTEDYLKNLKPLNFLIPILTSEKTFYKWIKHLGCYSIKDIKHKELGWNYIWRGSHVGGGIAATIAMTSYLFSKWWPEIITNNWFKKYFSFLNSHNNKNTGLWQQAFYNIIFKKPTIIDIGGASHFWWIYEKQNNNIPNPEAAIKSIIKLQKTNGLYKNHPFCIDFDAINGLLTAYESLDQQDKYKDIISNSILKSLKGITNYLTNNNFFSFYNNLHGLPGALAAIAESNRATDLGLISKYCNWNRPFNKVWWL
jgi:hypothetical protein